MNYPFDIEIYQNFFCMVVKNPYTNKEYVFYSFGEIKDCRADLKKFLLINPTLIGFNSYSFDIPVLAYYLNHDLADTYQFAMTIINSKYGDRMPKIYYDCRDRSGINGIDLMRVLSIDGIGISLKQCGITIKWPKIQELPIPPDSFIDKEDIPVIVKYCKNDVGITNELYLKSLDDIQLRQYILDEYGVNVFNKSESGIANELMTQLYSRQLGVSPLVFKEQRTPRDVIPVKDCIGQNIHFVSDEMNQFYDRFIDKTTDGLQTSLNYCGNTYEIGVGGLHSCDKPAVFESGDKQLIDADVSSFYPKIIVLNGIKPAHLSDDFLVVFGRLLDDRLDAQQKGELLKAYSLKIAANSVGGKFKTEHFWLYDELCFYKMTISGQLYLLSLIDLLESNSIDVISANTDGIIVFTDKIDLFYELCQQWQNFTQFGLKFTNYKKYVRRDVNSYLAIKESGAIKTKGCFEDITTGSFSFNIRKRFKYPIVTKALHKFFINKEPVESTIKNHNSLYDFTFTQKPDKKFKVYFNDKQIQRINRIYVSNDGGRLYKTENGRRLSVVDDMVNLANDISDDTIPPDLDYDFYIKEANKIVHKIQPPVKQESLF
jgi:hypothetical protein